MAKLLGHRYGKAKVRVLKILRDGPVHRIKDISVATLLSGDFETSYTAGDNTKVVPTDTIKNTINVLAKQDLGDEIERFAAAVCDHFLKRYHQVAEVNVVIEERDWQRMNVDGKAHPHSFIGGASSRSFVEAVATGQSRTIHSGVRDLLILKSTASGFENYPKDEFTTLRETSDRILATSFSARWKFDRLPENCRSANDAIMSSMLKIFAENYSPSAQTTLFQMGEAALTACSEISQINLEMPNKHCLLIDLMPFGMPNKNEVFVPTDEPHGQIEAMVLR
jgi:urate oxidase